MLWWMRFLVAALIALTSAQAAAQDGASTTVEGDAPEEAESHTIQPLGPALLYTRELTDEEYTKMMRVEHDIWLRGRLLSGYQYAECSNDRLRLHRDILPFDQVPEEDRELDRALAQSVAATLRRHGYVLVALG